ncbi:MAG: DUF2065 domain-containing protein [Gammaproteobacteria bacterium]|nr:DUF2065 domain-containing protein [Gammaproteobacteria bacterium]
MWNDFAAALALLLVVEGIMPFVNPAGMRKSLQMIAEMEDKTLRTVGLSSMMLGVVLLYLVR